MRGLLINCDALVERPQSANKVSLHSVSFSPALGLHLLFKGHSLIFMSQVSHFYSCYYSPISTVLLLALAIKIIFFFTCLKTKLFTLFEIFRAFLILKRRRSRWSLLLFYYFHIRDYFFTWRKNDDLNLALFIERSGRGKASQGMSWSAFHPRFWPLLRPCSTEKCNGKLRATQNAIENI